MALLDRLLADTSRTFALAIPLLPEPTRREVTVAYLLFRVADTLEDAPHWGREARLRALASFAHLQRRPSLSHAHELSRTWLETPPCSHRGYLDLLQELPRLLEAREGLSPRSCRLVEHHVLATVEGMTQFMARGDENGRLHLADIEDLRRYCYVVAGVVGELLTDLFLAGRGALAKIATALRRQARAFGEGLQLVNILRDAREDARAGRCYLPADVDRARVLEMARGDLRIAADYVLTLQSAGAARGLVAFTALPVLLALATLDRVEELGAGAKLTRGRVSQLHHDLEKALDAGKPALVTRVS